MNLLFEPPTASSLLPSFDNRNLTGDTTVDTTLGDQANVTGQLTGYGGVPVAGATITMQSDQSSSGFRISRARTDAGQLPDVRARRRLLVAGREGHLHLPGGAHAEVEFSADLDRGRAHHPEPGLAGGSAAGTGAGPRGAGVAATEIILGTIQGDPGPPERRWNSEPTLVTDASGHFDFLALAVNGYLRAFPPVGGPHCSNLLHQDFLTDDLDFDLVLSTTPSLTGRVTGHAGSPFGGIELSVFGNDGWTRVARTDPYCSYRMSLPDGPYSIRSEIGETAPEAFSFTSQVDLIGPMTVDFPLPVVRMQGRVITGAGAPVPNVEIRTFSGVEQPSGLELSSGSFMSSDAAGRYTMLMSMGSAGQLVLDMNAGGFPTTFFTGVPFPSDMGLTVVLQRPDQDGDGVPDAEDACPTVPRGPSTPTAMAARTARRSPSPTSARPKATPGTRPSRSRYRCRRPPTAGCR